MQVHAFLPYPFSWAPCAGDVPGLKEHIELFSNLQRATEELQIARRDIKVALSNVRAWRAAQEERLRCLLDRDAAQRHAVARDACEVAGILTSAMLPCTPAAVVPPAPLFAAELPPFPAGLEAAAVVAASMLATGLLEHRRLEVELMRVDAGVAALPSGGGPLDNLAAAAAQSVAIVRDKSGRLYITRFNSGLLAGSALPAAWAACLLTKKAPAAQQSQAAVAAGGEEEQVEEEEDDKELQEGAEDDVERLARADGGGDSSDALDGDSEASDQD
jgi:hypothetical protein